MGLRAEQDGPEHILITGHPSGPVREILCSRSWSEVGDGQYYEFSPSRDLFEDETNSAFLSDWEIQDLKPEEISEKMKERREKEGPKFGICRHVYYERSLEELQVETQLAKEEWEKSSVCAILVELLKSSKIEMGKSLKRVTNVVAMGIGSMHEVNGEAFISRARAQFACVLTILEVLGEPGKPLPCVIQDPAYSLRDHEYLRYLGLDPVYDPDAFERIDTGSLVLSIGTYYRMFFEMSNGPRPAAFICEDHKGWSGALGHRCLYDEHNNVTEIPIPTPKKWIDGVDAMFKSCISIPFTKDKADDFWGSVLLHWRKEENEEEIDTKKPHEEQNAK